MSTPTPSGLPTSPPSPSRRHVPRRRRSNQTLTDWGDEPGWQRLVAVLRRIHAGERDPDTLTHGLDTTDTTITRRALDILTGQITLDPDTWHALTTSPADTDDEGAPALEDFLDAVVDAVRGNTHAPDTVTPVLQRHPPRHRR